MSHTAVSDEQNIYCRLSCGGRVFIPSPAHLQLQSLTIFILSSQIITVLNEYWLKGYVFIEKLKRMRSCDDSVPYLSRTVDPVVFYFSLYSIMTTDWFSPFLFFSFEMPCFSPTGGSVVLMLVYLLITNMLSYWRQNQALKQSEDIQIPDTWEIRNPCQSCVPMFFVFFYLMENQLGFKQKVQSSRLYSTSRYKYKVMKVKIQICNLLISFYSNSRTNDFPCYLELGDYFCNVPWL